MSEVNPNVSGYRLFRSIVEGDGAQAQAQAQEQAEAQLLATLSGRVKYFMDTLLTPGTRYRYALESVDFNGETSERSQHAGISVPRQPPLPPGQVTAFPSEGRVALRWDNPFDPSVQAVRIYRATANAQATLVAELTPEQRTYEDTSVTQGAYYFYYVVTVNGRGEESRREPVGVRVRR
jgi:fibronectin type 3 domain-containing protein